MNHSTPGLPVHHQLPEFNQTQVHRVSDAIQPSHPLLFPSPPAPNSPPSGSFPSQLFTWGGQSIGVSASTSVLPKKGKGGMIWENSIEICILSYVKQIANPGLMHKAGCSGLVHWDDPEGRDGEGGGRRVQMGNTCTPMADSCQCMAKITTIL